MIAASSAASPSSGERRRLVPLESLRKRSEFKRVYETENRCSGAAVLVHVYCREDTLPARLGLTVSRRCGKACVRNRIRRRLRELMRLEVDSVLPGWDIVLTARHRAAEAPYPELRRQVLRCLVRQGVYREGANRTPAHEQ